MKNIVLGSTLLFAIFSNCYAEPIRWNWVTAGSPPMPANSASGGYVGSSGGAYQYDMNNPADSNRYSIDLDAQRRDMMKINPGSLDELKGQNGGGFNYRR